MIFNPIFLQVAGQTETIDLPKQLKLKTPDYLFSDIIKIVGTSAPNKNPDESLVNADSIKSIQSGLQNILQSLNLNQKVQSPESKDSLNPNDASVSADIAAIIQAIQNSLNPKSAETKIINKTSTQLNPNQIALQIDNIVQTGNFSLSPINDQQNINNDVSYLSNTNNSNNLGTVKSSSDSQNSQNQNLTDKLLLSLQSGIPLSLNVSLNGSNYIVKFNPIIDNGNNIVNVSTPFGNDSINQESNKIYLGYNNDINKNGSVNPTSAELTNINKTSSQIVPIEFPQQIDNTISSENLNLLSINDQQNISKDVLSLNNSTNEKIIGTAKSSNDSANVQNNKFTDNTLQSLSPGNKIGLNVTLQGSNDQVGFIPVNGNGNVNNPLIIPQTKKQDIPVQPIVLPENKTTSNQFFTNNFNILQNYFKSGTFNIQSSIKKSDSTNNYNPSTGSTSTTYDTNSPLNSDLLSTSQTQFLSDTLPNTINTDNAPLPIINKFENNTCSKIITLTSNEDITSTHTQLVSQNILVTVEKVNPSNMPTNSNLFNLQFPKEELKNWLKAPFNNNITQQDKNPIIKLSPNNINFNDIFSTKVNPKQPFQQLPKANEIIQPESTIKDLEEIFTQNKFNPPDQNNSDAAAQVTAKPTEDQKIILQNLQNTPIANSDQPQTTANHLFANDLTPVKDVAYNSQNLSGDQNYKQNDNQNDIQKSITKQEILPNSKVPDSLNFLHDLTSVNKSKLPQTPVTASPENLRTVRPSDLLNDIPHLPQSSGTKSAVLNLDPDTLGKVKIVLDLTDKSVRANIQVDNEGTKQVVQNNINDIKQVTAKPVEDQKIILQNLQNTPIANSDQPQTTANHLFANDLTPVKDVTYNSQNLSSDQNYKQNDNLNDLQKSITKKDILPDSKVSDSLNFLHDLTSVNKSNLPQTPVTGSPENLRTVKPSDLPNEISHLVQSSGTKSIVLNLDPDTLGKVKIVLDLTDKSVRANIQVENEGAKQAVQNNINELKQSLNLNGLQLSSLNISLSNNDDKTNKSFLQKKKSTYNQYNPKIEETENSISSKSMGYNTYDYLI